MCGLEMKRTVSGDCMNWKSFGLPSATHKALKKENAICLWLSKDLWRLKTLSVLDTDYTGRSFLAMCLKTFWHFPLLLRIRNGNWLLLMTGQCFKNNESRSSYSLKIGRSTHWLGSFFLNAVLTIFSQESHRAHQVKVRTLELWSAFCRKLSVSCVLSVLSVPQCILTKWAVTKNPRKPRMAFLSSIVHLCSRELQNRNSRLRKSILFNLS